MASKRIRVYELARELGLSNKEALDLCERLRIGVKSHSSSIEDPQADRVRRLADSEGLRREVQPEEVETAPAKAEPPTPATVGAPEGAVVSEPAHGHSHQNPSLQLFTHAHSRHKCQTHSLLHESFDGLDRGQLERNVEWRVISGESLDHLDP